ncbi:helix-turn-helix domain-containing protein [Thiohalomonas denitrificans]|uniref:helix-turn-helix domain-containing protein n=1 Tax=Thiohalomonas denitrificans TaxID=415747 RepID=UPI0026F09099|nr:helix-turn-helix domain-containing protein [Thiohalomonas denitrificans]
MARRDCRRRPEVECRDCELFGICRVAGLGSIDDSLLDEVVSRRCPVAKGERLLIPDTPFRGIFAVKSGAFRTISHIGQSDRVINFHFLGELIGLETIEGGHYLHTVEALEESSVCELGFAHLHRLGPRLVQFQEQLIQAMSRRMLHDQQICTLLRAQNSERRLAAFLYSVANRLNAGREPASEFRLPMRREDIASYLGLAVETVSRLLTQFSQRRIAELRGRNARILDFDSLCTVAGLNLRVGRAETEHPVKQL